MDSNTDVASSPAGADGNRTQVLMSMIKHIKGTVDFNALAEEHGVANGEAMCKRVVRMLKREALDVIIRGCEIGDPDKDAPIAPQNASRAKAHQGRKRSNAITNKRKATEEADEDADGENAEEDVKPAKTRPKKTVPATKKVNKKPKVVVKEERSADELAVAAIAEAKQIVTGGPQAPESDSELSAEED